MLPTKFLVNWPFSSGEEAKRSLESIGLSVQEKKLNIDFQDGGHLGFLIRTILAIFDLQVTLMLPTKFRVK